MKYLSTLVSVAAKKPILAQNFCSELDEILTDCQTYIPGLNPEGNWQHALLVLVVWCVRQHVSDRWP